MPPWLSVLPARMDIASAYYPISRPRSEWKLRRCIVTDVLIDPTDGSVFCELAYGTSQPTAYGTPHLRIHNATDLTAMGLTKDTRFVMGERAIVPWLPGSFDCMFRRASPIVGRLLPHYHHEFQQCMAIYQAAQQDAIK